MASSFLTDLNTCWDLLSYGTSEDGVGILLYLGRSSDTAQHRVLDTGENILSVDMRSRKQTSLFKLENVPVPVEKTSFAVHPTEPQLVNLCPGGTTHILNLRNLRLRGKIA